MAKKKKATTQTGLAAAVDNSNGLASIVSDDLPESYDIEPIVAPMTESRAQFDNDGDLILPTNAIKRDGKTYVFGLDDVRQHGKANTYVRDNSDKRANRDSYYLMLDFLLLRAFPSYIGTSSTVQPHLAFMLPVSIWQDESRVAAIRDKILGDTGCRVIEDSDGCKLSVQLTPETLHDMPESRGAIIHYMVNYRTMKPRKGANVSGYVAVVDIGYETTDLSVYENGKPVPEYFFTLPGVGMKFITQEIVRKLGDAADESFVDRSLSNDTPNWKKFEYAPGLTTDISDLYPLLCQELAQRIVSRTVSLIKIPLRMVLVAGGGVYHLSSYLTEEQFGVPTEETIHPERANLYGAYIYAQKMRG